MKVVLITPYSGANLGDAAIQEAVIHNLRARSPDIDIRMATLSPERTTALHGVPSFPLTALEVAFYSEGIRVRTRLQPAASAEAGAGSPVDGAGQSPSRVKALLQKVPLLFNTLRSSRAMLQRVLKAPALLAREIQHAADAWRFARGADYFIVSGGGQIDDYWGGPWGHPYALLKWSILARLSGAHFVLMSVGVCSLRSRVSRHFVRSTLKRASYRSYRDEASRTLLAHLPFTRQDAVYPDLAFSFPLERARAQATRLDTTLTVGISPIAYLRSNWPEQDGTTYERYISLLTEFIRDLLNHGYRVVLFASDSIDRHPIREIRDAFSISHGVNPDQLICVLPETVDQLFAVLAQVDVVVASRLHGILLSHLVHKPVLAISYDRKVDTHMAYMQQAVHRLDIHSLDKATLDAAFLRLLGRFDEARDALAATSGRLCDLATFQYARVMET